MTAMYKNTLVSQIDFEQTVVGPGDSVTNYHLCDWSPLVARWTPGVRIIESPIPIGER